MEHYYDNVPGWAAFRELYSEMVREAPPDRHSVFVEVGSWLGRSAAYMGVEIKNSGKPITLHCIDPWIDGGPDLRSTRYYRELDALPYELFCQNTAPVASVIHPYQMMSLDAVKLFPDQSIDFLMLDGDHGYDAVKADIETWLPKMKPGTVISGDDYGWPGVERAVKEAFGDRAKVVWQRHHKDYRNSASYWSVRL